MKTVFLTAVAAIGVTIFAANWFVAQSNASPVLPKYTGAAVIRVADERQECVDNARKACMNRCRGNQSCYTDCYNEVFGMCWGGG